MDTRKQIPFGLDPIPDSKDFIKGKNVQFEDDNSTSLDDKINELESKVATKAKYYESDNEILIDPSNQIVVLRFTGTGNVLQTMPNLTNTYEGSRIFVHNVKTDSGSITIEPGAQGQTIAGTSEYSVAPNDWAEFVAETENDNWMLAAFYDHSTSGGITVRNSDGESANNITDLQFVNCLLSSTPPEAQFTPLLDIEESAPGGTVVNAHKLKFLPPIEVSEAESNVAEVGVNPQAYEERHSPSYYASFSEDKEVVGRVSAGVRTGVLWFDNVIKPAGVYIEIDRDTKSIGLQEDDELDPNITGGTPYFIYTRIAIKGTAPADGYVQLFLRDTITQNIIEDDNGRILAVRKAYKAGDKLGNLDIATIKKFTGIEQFQICVDEDFGTSEPIIIENRTEGNSCVLIQSIDSSDQTSRGLLQCENDLGKNFEWTAHYLGVDIIDIKYYLQQNEPTTTVPAGDGETSSDGWFLNNFQQISVGIASNILTFQDDGSNPLGFGFGNILSAEKTQIARLKNLNTYITLSTINEPGKVYAAKWTGTPDQYDRIVVDSIGIGGVPVLTEGWVLDGTSITCSQDGTGSQNTYSGAFTVPDDANNWAVFFCPADLYSTAKYEITDFHVDKDPAISGFFLHATEEAGERHLVEDDEYFKSGLNTEGYPSLRYTINGTKTPMPAGKKLKGAADITANWNQLGAAVDYLTFNQNGDADISTTLNVYTGESVAPGGQADVVFTWNRETTPDTWVPIPESETTFTCKKDVTGATIVTIPSFTIKVKNGDKIRLFAESEINDGAYIKTTSPNVYLCETTIDFKEFVPGTEDEPINTLYVSDSLDNTWEVTAGTDGHLQSILLGDLPENMKHHVVRDNFSLSDFSIVGGVISLVEKATKQEYTEINSNVDLDGFKNYIVDTTNNTVTINIPYEEVSAFTVRDEAKEFDVNNCIITVRDEFNAIIHTATLDKRDKEWRFYFDGVNWRYGEIGKGLMVDIASDHIASLDFGDLIRDNDDNTCRVIQGGVCYENTTDQMDLPEALTCKSYVDGLVNGVNPRIDAHVSVNFTVDQVSGEFIFPFDTVTKNSGITLSTGEFTFAEAGRYSGYLAFYANEESDPRPYIWVERYPSGGSAWELLGNMMRPYMKEDSAYGYGISAMAELDAGDKIRLKILIETPSPDKIDFQSQSKVVTAGTLVQPSAAVSINKIGEKTPL